MGFELFIANDLSGQLFDPQPNHYSRYSAGHARFNTVMFQRAGREKDVKAYLERLRVQISECEMIRALATDPKKRELFTRLADHFKVLASELEKALRDEPATVLMDRKTQEPFPKVDDEQDPSRPTGSSPTANGLSEHR